MSSTTRKRKNQDSDEGAEIVLDVDSPKENTNKKAKESKSPKSSTKKAEKKTEPQRLFDEWGREIDKDGWLVEPVERLKQGRLGEIIKQLNELHEKEPDTHHVLLTVAFYKIDKIDTVEQSAFVDFTTQTWWKEPAVKDKKDGEYDVSTFEFKHCIEPGEAIELEKLIEDGNSNHSVWVWPCPGYGSFSSNGIVTSWNRYRGTVAFPMHLHDFPFDKQRLTIKFESEAESMPWMKIYNHTPAESLTKLGQKLTLQLTEFDVVGEPVAEEVVKFDDADFTNWSQIHIHFDLRRRIGYYVLKILTVLMFLAVLMGLSFIVPADVLNDRFQIAATLFLSAVAFNFVVAEQVPKVSYTTALDKYFFVEYAFIVLSVFEHVAMFLVQDAYGKQVARDADWRLCIIFISLFTLWTICWFLWYLRKHKQHGKIAK